MKHQIKEVKKETPIQQSTAQPPKVCSACFPQLKPQCPSCVNDKWHTLQKLAGPCVHGGASNLLVFSEDITEKLQTDYHNSQRIFSAQYLSENNVTASI
jgi:hypothetical protein